MILLFQAGFKFVAEVQTDDPKVAEFKTGQNPAKWVNDDSINVVYDSNPTPTDVGDYLYDAANDKLLKVVEAGLETIPNDYSFIKPRGVVGLMPTKSLYVKAQTIADNLAVGEKF